MPVELLRLHQYRFNARKEGPDNPFPTEEKALAALRRLVKAYRQNRPEDLAAMTATFDTAAGTSPLLASDNNDDGGASSASGGTGWKRRVATRLGTLMRSITKARHGECVADAAAAFLFCR